jgi:hypothetical protein
MTYGYPWIAKISDDNISVVVVDIGGLQHILISSHLDFASKTIKKNGPGMVSHSRCVYGPSFPWAHLTDVLAYS